MAWEICLSHAGKRAGASFSAAQAGSAGSDAKRFGTRVKKTENHNKRREST